MGGVCNPEDILIFIAFYLNYILEPKNFVISKFLQKIFKIAKKC